MRTFNLNGIEILSNRELAAVKGGGEEGIPTPIIIVEEGDGVPASATGVETLTALFVVAPASTKKTKKTKK
jgi:methyl coenzyme M reductase subunit C